MGWVLEQDGINFVVALSWEAISAYLSAHHKHIMPCGFAGYLMGGRTDTFHRIGPLGPLQHHPSAGCSQSYLHKFNRILIRAHDRADQAHFILRKGSFFSRWMHRVDQHHFRRKGGQQVLGITMKKGHAVDCFCHVATGFSGACQPFFQ